MDPDTQPWLIEACNRSDLNFTQDRLSCLSGISYFLYLFLFSWCSFTPISWFFYIKPAPVHVWHSTSMCCRSMGSETPRPSVSDGRKPPKKSASHQECWNRRVILACQRSSLGSFVWAPTSDQESSQGCFWKPDTHFSPRFVEFDNSLNCCSSSVIASIACFAPFPPISSNQKEEPDSRFQHAAYQASGMLHSSWSSASALGSWRFFKGGVFSEGGGG